MQEKHAESCDTTYKIPLISSRLREEEALIQTVDTLQHFERCSRAAFDQIGQRVERQRSRLSRLGSRIDAAKAKVETVCVLEWRINENKKNNNTDSFADRRKRRKCLRAHVIQSRLRNAKSHRRARESIFAERMEVGVSHAPFMRF